MHKTTITICIIRGLIIHFMILKTILFTNRFTIDIINA